VKRDWKVHVDGSCDYRLKWSHLHIGHILSNQELIIQLIQEIERCKRGMCKTNEGNVKQKWRAALLTGTYKCASVGWPIDVGNYRYEVDPKEGTLMHGTPGKKDPWASADTVIGRKLDDRIVIFSERPSDCWAREIAHEALHAVFRDHSHENISGDDGLEKCITCGGRL